MTQPQQLGFGFDAILHERETAHLPGAMEKAIPYYRTLIERHHAEDELKKPGALSGKGAAWESFAA
jgi:hypothetical protein